MSNQPVQTVGAAGDKIKIILSLLAVIAGVVGFYVLSDKATAVRAGVLVVGLLVAIALGWTSAAGRDLMNFSKEAIRETKKVVWPTRRETLQMTAIVFVFVLVMALFLWSTDKVLEVVLYDLILGWKR